MVDQMRLLLHPANHDHRLAEIRLGVAGSMRQRDKHLSATPPLFPDVILDRRVTVLKLVFVTQSFRNALGGVALLTGTLQIVLHPLINEARETIELGPLNICRPLIAGRHREHHLLLLHARTRYPEMARRRTFAHTATTREADLPVKFHAENTPALPENRKGQSGKVLLCPQQDYPATSVAHFCIAVLSHSRQRISNPFCRRMSPNAGRCTRMLFFCCGVDVALT
jgi:hypothetical protein